MSAHELRWALVAAPDDPAVPAWFAAAEPAGVAEPRLVPWAEVLDGRARFAENELVHAERLTPTVPLRYGGSRHRYEAHADARRVLDGLLADSGARATIESATVLLALDRQRCTAHLAAAGVPVPEPGEKFIRQRFAEPGDAVSNLIGHIWTPMALIRTRSGFELEHRPVRRLYRQEGDESNGADTGIVQDLLDRDDEPYKVADLPTAYLNSVQHRFRFAVIDGRVTHAAGRPADVRPVREYYGGKRREIDAYRTRFGAAAWQELIRIAEQAAAAFPGLRSVGVDLAPVQVNRDPTNPASALPPDVVYDIDPFGARLPGALGMPGTAGEGLEVAATTLRGWAGQRDG